MNLKKLQTFYWAAKLGSFTAAAKRMNATQSTVSTRIQELEQDFGVTLFDRSHRTAHLTAKGKELVSYVGRLLDLTREIQSRISATESLSGLVQIGVAEVISVTWLPRFVKELHKRYPKIIVEYDVALTTDLIRKMDSGALDIIFAPTRVPMSNLIVRSLGTVEFEWMASPSFEIPQRHPIPSDLQDLPIIALPKNSHHHERVEEWFRSNGAVCKRIDTCNSMSVVAALTVASLGISVFPVCCYQKELEQGQLRIIDTEPRIPPVEFFAMIPADDLQPITRLIADIADEISDFDRTP